MQAQHPLFDLISSLSSSEKRYFSQMASTFKGDSHLVKLFDVLSKMDSYNEKVLTKRLKDPAILKNLASLKNKLQSAILKSMRAYNSNKTLKLTLQSMLMDIEFLYEKKLFSQCRKLISKAEKIANESHLNSINILIQDWKHALYRIETLESRHISKIKELQRNYESTLKRINNHSEYKLLSLNIRFATDTKYRHEREDSRVNFYKNVKLHRLLKEKDYPNCFWSKVYFYRLNSNCCYFAYDYEQAYHYENELKKIVETSKSVDSDKVVIHMETLNTLLNMTRLTKRYTQFDDILRELRNLPKRYPKYKNFSFIKDKIYPTSYIFELSHCNTTGLLDRSRSIVELLIKDIHDAKDQWRKNHRFWAMISIANYYFMIGNYTEALYWNYQLLSAKNPKQSGYYYNARIQSLMIHFELSNQEVLSSHLRSVYRYLLEKEALSNFDKLMLKFMQNSFNTFDKRKRQELFKNFNKELMEIANDVDVVSELCILEWVESKTKNKSIQTLMEEKARFIYSETYDRCKLVNPDPNA